MPQYEPLWFDPLQTLSLGQAYAMVESVAIQSVALSASPTTCRAPKFYRKLEACFAHRYSETGGHFGPAGGNDAC